MLDTPAPKSGRFRPIMGKDWPKYLSWREGRPRWNPGPGLRALGFVGVDLKDETGAWLPKGAAVTKAEALNKTADAKRQAAPAAPQTGLKKDPRAIEALWDRYSKSEKFTRLAPKTRKDYRNKIRLFLDGFEATKDHDLGEGISIRAGDRIDGYGRYNAAAIDTPICYAFAERVVFQKGRAMGNGVMAVVRRLFAYGKLIGWRGDNPATQLGLAGVKPRTVTFDPSEVVEIVAAAERTGFLSVGEAFVLAIHQGQREGDILRLPDAVAVNGRIDVRQSKRGKIVSVRLTAVAARFACAALARKRKAKITATALIVNERTGRPYTDTDQFGKNFRKVRADACADLIMRGREGDAYRLFGKRFQDTRDTYLTRSHRAGNDAKRRATVSGHDPRTQVQVEEAYLAADSGLADEAQDKLEAWMAEQGIAL